MKVDRLVSFLRQLCREGILVTWFLPGPENELARIRNRVGHDGFRIAGALPKREFMQKLAQQDVGLLWAPVGAPEGEPEGGNYAVAAPHKPGEYFAAGLGAVYTRKPALAFLQQDGCGVPFDPFDPEAEARRIAGLLADREAVFRMRANGLGYHYRVLNAETQCAAFVDWLDTTVRQRR